jgi:hypothetical protein
MIAVSSSSDWTTALQSRSKVRGVPAAHHTGWPAVLRTGMIAASPAMIGQRHASTSVSPPTVVPQRWMLRSTTSLLRWMTTMIFIHLAAISLATTTAHPTSQTAHSKGVAFIRQQLHRAAVNPIASLAAVVTTCPRLATQPAAAAGAHLLVEGQDDALVGLHAVLHAQPIHVRPLRSPLAQPGHLRIPPLDGLLLPPTPHECAHGAWGAGPPTGLHRQPAATWHQGMLTDRQQGMISPTGSNSLSAY